jgi:type 1 fimbria pilin
MKLSLFAHLAKRIAVVLLVVGLLLPMTCAAFVIKTTNTQTRSLAVTAQASGAQAPPCGPNPYSNGTIAASITLPTPITVAPGTANGLISSSASTTVTIYCFWAFQNTPNYYDDFTVLTGNLAAVDTANASPTGKGIMFSTTVPGIDVLLTASTAQATSGNNGPNGGQGWAIGPIDCSSAGSTGSYTGKCTPNPITATITAQLVKTGPVTPGTVSSIQLLQFFDSDDVPANPPGYGTATPYPNASNSYGSLTLNAVTVNMSSCNVTAASASLSVTLPPIVASQLSTTGSVAGQTSFPIQYTCAAGWSLYMTMSTTNPGTATGVIMPSTSCSAGTPATNVGIQLLQPSQQPVTFNTAQSLGSSLSGTQTFTYYAQYYATGSPVSAGAVCGTATFNMSYQ